MMIVAPDFLLLFLRIRPREDRSAPEFGLSGALLAR